MNVRSLPLVLSAFAALAGVSVAGCGDSAESGASGTVVRRPEMADRPQVGDTITTETGLKYAFTQLGSGPRPDTGDLMIIHGVGTFTDGSEFWNTRTENAPYEYMFGVDGVIRGFSEGMGYVREGDRVTIEMMPELAYGDRDRAGIPPNSTLIFDYEILRVPKGSVRSLLREGSETGGVDARLARIRALPDMASRYASESSIRAAARNAEREEEGAAEKVLALGVELLPESFRLHAGLGRAQAERGAAREAIASYEAAVRLNPRVNEGEQQAYETALEALVALRGG